MDRTSKYLMIGIILVVLGFLGCLALAAWMNGATVAQAQAISWPPPPYQPVNVSFSSTSAQTLVAAPSAGGVCVYGLLLTNANASTATTMSVYLDGGTTAVATLFLGANGGSAGFQILNSNPQNPYFLTNAGQGFVVKSSAAVQIDGTIYAATCP